MKKFFLLIVSLLFTAGLIAQTGKYSNEFLDLGVDARAFAMAKTMTAISNDVTSGYWNPAGLARMEKKIQASFMHAEYFAGIAKYDYAAVAYKIDSNSSIAISYLRFGVDNIMNTTELIDNQGNINYDRISYFSAADNAFLLSYAYRFNKVKGLYLGANAKVIRRTIGDFAGSWGFGFDLGLQYENKGWQVGAMLKDATSTFNAWNYTLTNDVIDVLEATGNEIPENSLELTSPKLNIGVGKYLEMGKGFNATFAIDFDCTFDGRRNTVISSDFMSIDPHLGMEFAYKKIVAIRAGLGSLQQYTDFDQEKKTSMQINLGLGVGIKDFIFIDYAFTNIGNISGELYSHIFSARVAFDSFKRKK